MKKHLLIAASIVLANGLVLAQNNPGSGPVNNSNTYNWNNSASRSNNYNYVWGTNHTALGNAAMAGSNQFSHAYAGKSAAGGGGQVQNRFGKTEQPADVQALVQQFQQDRDKLMNQLKSCSEEQRQQILKEMEQLRLQLKEQVTKIREDARQQAEQMRSRFGNNRDAILDQGAGKTGTSRDR